MSNGTLRYWLSWNEPFDAEHGADPRPLRLPLPPSVVGWWCTGEGETYSTVCAVVDVNGTVETAKKVITEFWRPADWRFTDCKGWAEAGWLPEPSRFPFRATSGA